MIISILAATTLGIRKIATIGLLYGRIYSNLKDQKDLAIRKYWVPSKVKSSYGSALKKLRNIKNVRKKKKIDSLYFSKCNIENLSVVI
jgi:hypothetical protein